MSDQKSIKVVADAPVARKEEGWWETVKVIVQALLIALVVRSLLFQPFNIPSGSLIPTLLIGDYLFVSKYSFGYSKYSFPSLDCGTQPTNLLMKVIWLPIDVVCLAMPEKRSYQLPISGRIFGSSPKRGDIVVFRPPGDADEDFIKRVIGLPGDHVQMKQDRLYINGTMVPRDPAPPYEMSDPYGKPSKVAHYYETLPDSSGAPGGVRHEIIQRDGDEGALANTQEFVVPPEHFFMMGDNRDNSSDSRVVGGVVGYVPAENLIGRAEIIFFSIEEGTSAWEIWRWPEAVRWNRLFQRVR